MNGVFSSELPKRRRTRKSTSGEERREAKQNKKLKEELSQH